MNPRAILRTPVSLSEKTLQDIAKKIGLPEVQQEIDRSIPGGFLIQIGDRYLDYTTHSVLSGRSSGEEYSSGIVGQIGDGVAKVNGLSTAMAGEIVAFDGGSEGLVLNLNTSDVGVVVLGDAQNITVGDRVTTTGRILSIPVGRELLGRIVNPLGEPLDGKGPLSSTHLNPLERIAPGVMARESISVPLQTGIKAIDAMIPIGRGQRELVIGDRQTGKTSIALTTIMNQKDQKVVCIYCAIGQRQASIAQLVSVLEDHDAMKHSIIVAASASDAPAMQYLAPYAGCAIAEYFLGKGSDALIIYDDLTKHAWAYRQLSLLLRRPSGREAFPGDIFYAHSRLLERACRLNEKHGGGSITAIPIIETQAGDLSAYIPTNVISITDGQLYLEADLFNMGLRPAINVGNSVSRVGGAAQVPTIKQVAGRMRLDLAQYRELAAFAQFSTDLDEKTQQQLARGARMTELLKQPWDTPMPVEYQVLSLWAGTHGYLDGIKTEDVGSFESHLFGYVGRHGADVLDTIRKERVISDDLEKRIDRLIRDAAHVFLGEHEQYQSTPASN